jgi:hypothetical protein
VHDRGELVIASAHHAVGDFKVVDDVRDIAEPLAIGVRVELEDQLDAVAFFHALGKRRCARTEYCRAAQSRSVCLNLI